ncbi:MAG TPA: substrate-binding domain-containing protein [Anaerolineales bacterium]|nr:substrate-binding domain-containing protein [Anaerolineales bacterium]
MYNHGRKRPTIGFLSTWSIYEGTTIDNYTHALLQGVCAAARERDCDLLMGCGISLPGSPLASRTAWAVPGADMDFIPVGPWNTDGLIIIPDDFTNPQFEYVQDLIRSGYPVILTTAERPGPLVAVDNAGGIQQAFDHLWQHGHRQIAFIAGKKGRGGDSAERLAAYRQALRAAGMEADERLIAFGEHRREDGRLAMQQILATGAPFTALLASNDLSGLGAMEVLRETGRRIPEDVAVIGFDDILEARSQLPLLTTVRHPTFMVGYQAALSLLEMIHGQATSETSTRVATQLVIRQSCGCRPEYLPVPAPVSPASLELETVQAELARAMARASAIEFQYGPTEEIESLCLALVRAFMTSLARHDPAQFDAAMQQLFDWIERHGEEAYPWQVALSTLRRGLPGLLSADPGADPRFADMLVDRARLVVAETAQRQATELLLRHMDTSNRLGLMTSQLLAALDESASTTILESHLPQLGVDHALVALYSPREDDPLSYSTVLLGMNLSRNKAGFQFMTREFPPPGLFPSGQALQLVILPLVIDEHTSGFVALSASNLELCAAIVHNLAAALRTSQLYRDALEGRKLAEEANRLKSRFLSMVSHELRTPLSLIVGLSEMVLRERQDPAGAALRDVEQINISAQHLARLIGDVLDLASSEAGQLRIVREPLDLAEVLNVAVKIGEQMAREKGLEWQALMPARGPFVIGDRTRLRQVTLNLISNAIKFTPAGRVVLDVRVVDQQVLVSVSDTGIGIPPAERDTIFREFYRSERSIQSGYGGLGLGLAITKQLVEQHGGVIGARSPGDLGSGSTFFFNLPVAPQAVFEMGVSATPQAYGYSVVVLTEHADPAERLCAYLRERGFVLRTYQVDEQVEWLSDVLAAPPAALIIGEHLAAREGWAIIGTLKRQPSTEHIPVLAYSLDEGRDQGELLELNYLHKPLQLEQLAEELQRYCPGMEQRLVLIVDDDPGILDLHSRLVKQIGCQALTARNGRAALEVIEHTLPDLILLDLMMPEMDGFAVIEALQARETTRAIPVIVLTAHLLSEAELERCNHGVSAILSKGVFSTAETLNHIEAALTRQHTLGKATQQIVRQAMACIHTRYSEALSREDIANHIGISPDYLTDCFRQELGIPPMIYLRRYRIRQARELLETTDMSIMQVALEVGFSESAHFTRTFQREVGKTPRAYRIEKRG